MTRVSPRNNVYILLHSLIRQLTHHIWYHDAKSKHIHPVALTFDLEINSVWQPTLWNKQAQFNDSRFCGNLRFYLNPAHKDFIKQFPPVCHDLNNLLGFTTYHGEQECKFQWHHLPRVSIFSKSCPYCRWQTYICTTTFLYLLSISL